MSTLTDRTDLAQTLMDIALGGACPLDACKALGLALAVLDATEEVPDEHGGGDASRVVRMRAVRGRILAVRGRILAELSAAGGEL